jgi:hypothetical protein
MKRALNLLELELLKVKESIHEVLNNERSIMSNIPHDDLLAERTELESALKHLRNAALAEPSQTSDNTESMPCLVGVRGNLCSLGFGGRCSVPACQITRTAHVS